MAQIALLSKGMIYDTDKQMAQLHQVVDRFTLGDGNLEKCVVTEVALSPEAGYSYTLVGLTTSRTYTTCFVCDAHDSCTGFFADMSLPVFLDGTKLDPILDRAAAEERARIEREDISSRFLHRDVRIVEYSPRCLAIFTSRLSDAQILEGIRAKRNPNLTYQGRKVAGWILPKSRQQELSAIVSLC